MRSIAVSKLKATCLAVIAEVNKTGRSVLVTRFGKPVAEIVPPTRARQRTGWLGAMRGTGRIVGNIVSPATLPKTWEALRR